MQARGAQLGAGSTGTAQGLVPEGTAGFAATTPCCQGWLFPPCLGCQCLARCLAFKSPIQSTKTGFLQCMNKRHFCGRESWFKSNSGGRKKWAKLQVPLSVALAAPGVQSLCPA